MALRDAFTSPDAKRRYVARVFGTIADRYDLATVLLSCGRDRRWKRRLAETAGVTGGERALDLACGTGDITFEIAGRGARTFGLDMTPRMIELAAAKRPAGRAAFLIGDMLRLPFPDEAFDLVTVGYGLRNVSAIETAIDEIFRVLRPGGRVLSLDFNRPEGALLRRAYLSYLTVVGAALGVVLHGDADTYRYIAESIRRYPGARGVARLMERSGFHDARVVPLLGGLMALNLARRAGGAAPVTVR